MATYYVDGTNGNNSYNGQAATFTGGSTGPKATITAGEALLAAGDLLHIRPGVYRELVSLSTSGTSGNPIEYRGDYAGAVWAGGGVVRITGSNDDKTASRNGCIFAVNASYRTFRGLALDTSSGTTSLLGAANGSDWTVEECVFQATLGFALCSFAGAAQARHAIRRCVFLGHIGSNNSITLSHSATLNDVGHVVEQCLFVGRGGSCISIQRVGGVTVRNCTFIGGAAGVRVEAALAAGQTATVNNCIIWQCSAGLQATTLGELVEDYNSLSANVTARSNVSVGANSNTYPPLFDPRWAFQLIYAASANQVVTPFDLASYSQLVNVAGTSPTTTDLRGTSAIGGTREWGALEYDSALKIQGGGGGAVSIGPSRRGLGG